MEHMAGRDQDKACGPSGFPFPDMRFYPSGFSAILITGHPRFITEYWHLNAAGLCGDPSDSSAPQNVLSTRPPACSSSHKHSRAQDHLRSYTSRQHSLSGCSIPYTYLRPIQAPSGAILVPKYVYLILFSFFLSFIPILQPLSAPGHPYINQKTIAIWLRAAYTRLLSCIPAQFSIQSLSSGATTLHASILLAALRSMTHPHSSSSSH